MWTPAVCPRCGYIGHSYVPNGGDGSVEVMRRHKTVGAPGYCLRVEVM